MRRYTALLLAAVLAAMVQVPAAGAQQKPMGRWEKLPLAGAGGVQDLAAEPDGPVWISSGRGILYWNGEAFVPPKTGEMRGGGYAARFYGGGDRDLYVGQPVQKEHTAGLFRLSDGAAAYVTDFYYDVPHEPPGLFVGATGKVYNWGKRFLAVFSRGEWKRIEARLGMARAVAALEAGGKVWFFCAGRMYVADEKDELSEATLEGMSPTDPQRGRVVGQLIGDRYLLVTDQNQGRPDVWDLTTLKRVRLASIEGAFAQGRISDAFRAPDGSLWVWAYGRGRPGFSRIAPDLKVQPIEEIGDATWDSDRTWHNPRATLFARGGALWLACSSGDLVRIAGGEARAFGWADGVSLMPQSLAEDAQGRIYAAGGSVLYQYDPARPPGPPPPETALWKEWELASSSSAPFRDAEGNLWMFLKDREKQVSRWDGREWTDLPVPFNTRQVQFIMADDSGRLLVQADRAYQMGAGAARSYDSMDAALAAAVAAGARRFLSGVDSSGCAVAPPRIWYCRRGHNQIRYFDGEVWDDLQMENGVAGLFEHPKRGMVLQTQRGEFYTYDRGWIVEFPVDRSPGALWLMGPNGAQPFDAGLLKAGPDRFLPVRLEKTEGYGQAHYRALSLKPGADPAGPDAFVEGDPLPFYSGQAVLPAGWGGFWYVSMHGARVRRVLAGRAIEVNPAGTPFDNKSQGQSWVLEDRAHGLWFGARRGNRNLVLQKKMEGFEIKVGEAPAVAGKRLELTATSDFPGLDPKDLRVFWRLREGPWMGGEAGGRVVVEFPGEGAQEVELIGMDAQGGTTPRSVKLNLTVKAAVP